MTRSRPILPLLLLSCYLLSLFTSSLAQSSNSYDFTIGDFNNDGRDDYIRKRTGDWATNDAQGNAELFLAQEDGQFEGSTLPAEFDIRTNSVNLYVGDFNGDGIDDLLRQETGNWASDRANTANLLLADGNGGFTKNMLSEDFRLGGPAVAKLWVADFNGDGRDDIFRQEKDIDRPEFGISSHGITNLLLAVDSQTEFFVAVNPSPAIDLSSQTPQGTFASRQVAAYVGNFFDENYADVIKFISETGLPYKGTIYSTNMYGGYFREVNITNELGSGGYFHLGDYNGDGKDDFIQSSSFLDGDGNKLFLSTNNGEGTFEEIPLSDDLKLDTEDVLVGDFNGDGNADLMSKGDKVQVYLSTGEDFDIIDQPFSAESVFYLGDFNGDNMTDVLEYTGGEDGSVVVHLSNGDGTFSSA